MFEFRLRILDVGEGSYLGIVEGFPDVMVHARSPSQAEADLVRALGAHLEGLQDREATRIELDDFPTIRVRRLYLVLLPHFPVTQQS
jgi:predicted RNase H-like HicB family nuclease